MSDSENRTDSEERTDPASETEEGTVDAGTNPDEERTSHPDADAAGPDTHGQTEPVGQRSTAPQSASTARQVAIGFLVFGIGSIIAIVLPLVLA